MKVKFLSLIFVLAAFAAAGNAQSVVVTGKKVTYKRPKPISEYKRSFTITYPMIKAATPTLSKKIESAISYESVLNIDVKEELQSQWLEKADYKVGYNKNGILSIKLLMQGVGAYPDGSSKNVVVDLRTGSRVKPSDVFKNLPSLLARVKKAKEKEVAKAIQESKKDPENNYSGIKGLFDGSDANYKVTLDELSVTDKGVTFHHNYEFSHATESLEPAGEFFFSWAELKPYIKAGGLLSRIGR